MVVLLREKYRRVRQESPQHIYNYPRVETIRCLSRIPALLVDNTTGSDGMHRHGP
jgi:hypothetical protein